MRLLNLFLCSLLIFISTISFQPHRGSLSAQPNATKVLKRYAWINGGIGTNNIDFGFGGNVNYMIGSTIISARYFQSNDLGIEFGMGRSQVDYSGFWDIGILVGLITKSESAMASIAVGICNVEGDRYVEVARFPEGAPHPYIGEEARHFQTTGFPIETQLFLTPLPVMGFGLYSFVNFNQVKSYYGFLICLQLGKLR